MANLMTLLTILAFLLGWPLLLLAAVFLLPAYLVARHCLPSVVPSLGFRRRILDLVQADVSTLVTGIAPGEHLFGGPSPLLTDLGGPHDECPSPQTNDSISVCGGGLVSPDGPPDLAGSSSDSSTSASAPDSPVTTPDSPLSEELSGLSLPVPAAETANQSWADLVEDEDPWVPTVPVYLDNDIADPDPDLLTEDPLPATSPGPMTNIPVLAAEWECACCGEWTGGMAYTGPAWTFQAAWCSNPDCGQSSAWNGVWGGSSRPYPVPQEENRLSPVLEGDDEVVVGVGEPEPLEL